MRDLKQVLQDDYGLDLTGWELNGGAFLGGCLRTDISADGLTIVGSGRNPSGDVEAWIAVLAEPTITVEIDIKPGSDRNPINPMSLGLIPVAILDSDAFDVGDVDVTTLAFGPAEAAPAHEKGGHLEHVNDDGFTDMLSHYRRIETGIVVGDTEACVTGETLDGIPFEGCDSVQVLSPPD